MVANDDTPVNEKPEFVIAMLKVAMELKRSRFREIDEVIDRTLVGVEFDKEEFRRYLIKNMDFLVDTVQRNRK